MANFIEKTLEPGETVILKGRLHWSYNFRYTAVGILAIILGIGGLIMAQANESLAYSDGAASITVIGAIFVILGVLSIGFGYFLRSKTEFAVTNTRFIQKDGIFNIKMTEIPLFKVETINFYQTVFERMIGTGSIELVGSGGTNHKVSYLQQPYNVRNIIATYMKENKKEQ